MNDKGTLITSQAGMRLIAQQTLLNRGDFERLRGYLMDNYTTAALESQPIDRRLADLRAIANRVGKLRVYQVVAASKHQAVAVMEAQHGDTFYMLQVAVEEDYPHKITAFSLNPLE